MSKHALELPTPSSSGSPSKRARFDPAMYSPEPRRRQQDYASASTNSSPYTRYSFPSPGSTSSSFAYTIPSDSPSNPFGLQRALVALKLPRPVGFAHHLALRFQLVYDAPATKIDGGNKGSGRSRGRSRDKECGVGKALAKELENVYRIVQVPTNYTFRHLHKLILWLFAADARWERSKGSTRPTRHRRSSRLKDKGKVRPADADLEDVDALPRARPVIGVAVPLTWVGHTFEVRDDAQLYRSTYRPGTIKPNVGRARVRLSSVRDRKLFPELYGGEDWDGPLPFADPSEVSMNNGDVDLDLDTDGDAVSVPETGFEEDVDDISEEDQGGTSGGKGGKEKESKAWVWEAEDDYTIRHVWPDGPDQSRGIIYHHLPGVSVHITMNTVGLPRRKGSGNQPYVFKWRGSARGAIRVSHLAPSSYFDSHQPLEALSNEIFEDEMDTEERWLLRWNDLDAFARFLAREEERERALRRLPAVSLPSPPSARAQGRPSPFPFSRPKDASLALQSFEGSLPPSSPPRYSSSPTRSSSPHGSPSRPRYAFPSSSPGRPDALPARHARTSPRARAFSFPHPAHATNSDPRPRTLSSPARTLGSLPATTPFPAHPLLARRVQRATRRLVRITKRGLGEVFEREARGRKWVKEKAGRAKSGGRNKGKGKGVVRTGKEILIQEGDEEEDHVEKEGEHRDGGGGTEMTLEDIRGEDDFDGDALFGDGARDDEVMGFETEQDEEGGDAHRNRAQLEDGHEEGHERTQNGSRKRERTCTGWIGKGRMQDWDPYGEEELCVS